jgi:hypothetical protein
VVLRIRVAWAGVKAVVWGEGWGDFLATTIRSTKNYSDYAMLEAQPLFPVL